jgi:hypothetical protein
MKAARHHIPDVVKERIRQIGCVKIYEHSTANKPSFIQWVDDKSSLKWTSPGSRKHHTKALSQQIKSQLQHDFQQNDDSYADDGIWRSEVLLAAILARLNVLLLVLGHGYVSPDAWKAWSSCPTGARQEHPSRVRLDFLAYSKTGSRQSQNVRIFCHQPQKTFSILWRSCEAAIPWNSHILNPQALNPRVLSSLSSTKELPHKLAYKTLLGYKTP